MENVMLGELIKEGDPQRDAIHIACCPVIAGEEINVTGPLKFAFGSKEIVLEHRGDEYGDTDPIAGIPDPYLIMRPRPTHYDYRDRTVEHPHRIRKGDRFWMLMLPGTATGLVHHYHHPLLDDQPVTTNEHEIWLRRFAQSWGFRYDEMIAVATNPEALDEEGDFNDYITAHGKDLHSADELGDELGVFWKHIEGLAGRTFDQAHRDQVGWTCTC